MVLVPLLMFHLPTISFMTFLSLSWIISPLAVLPCVFISVVLLLIYSDTLQYVYILAAWEFFCFYSSHIYGGKGL